MRGEPFLYAGAVTALIRDYLHRSKHNDRLPDSILTTREEEIVKLIAEGHSSKEIAAALVISAKTVDRHRANILQSWVCVIDWSSPGSPSGPVSSSPDVTALR